MTLRQTSTCRCRFGEVKGWEVLTLFVAIITQDFMYPGEALVSGFSKIPLALFSKVQINHYKLLKIILCTVSN